MSKKFYGPVYWNRMVERTLNERQSWAEDMIFLGDHYQLGSPLVCPLSLFSKHAIVYGPPGTGKTVLAAQLGAQLIALGHNVLVLDCKGSLVLLNSLLDEAARAVDRNGQSLHEVRVINPSGRYPSHIYNPCQQVVWKNAAAHKRAQSWTGSMGIFGEEGSDTAFFASQAMMIATLIHQWYPEATSSAEFLSLINDRELYVAKGGYQNDWNHSRHLAANLLLLAASQPLNASPTSPDQAVELTELFVGPRPWFVYFFLSAIEDQRLTGLVGRFVLEQLRKAAAFTRTSGGRRRTFVICDEGQELFGAVAGNALEQLREFGVSIIFLHQSRAQLVTEGNDYRDRFDNAVGVQLCLGVRTPEDFKYLMDTDREVLDYQLSWSQEVSASHRIVLHPHLAYQGGVDAPRLEVKETKRPRHDREFLMTVSADPHGGFIRGFLNEGLWAYDASWVPFRWFHHLTKEEHDAHTAGYPAALPGQLPPCLDMAAPSFNSKPVPPVVSTGVDQERLAAILDQLSQRHRDQQSRGPK